MIGDELDLLPLASRPGRGAATNRVGRFEPYARVEVDDGWDREEEARVLRTEVAVERPRSVITRNTSPDVGFDRSINPYRGCEHGCIYCFARPTHAYLGLSPGLDFETRLVARPEAPRVLQGRARPPRLPPGADRARHQHRPLPADREALRHHARHPRDLARLPPPGDRRHQGHARRARRRHPRRDGPPGPRPRRRLGDDPRPHRRPRHGAARPGPRAAAQGDPHPHRRRLPGSGDDGPHRPRPHRPRDRAPPRRRPRRRRGGGELRGAAPAARGGGALPRLALRGFPRPRRQGDERGARDAWRPRLRPGLGQAHEGRRRPRRAHLPPLPRGAGAPRPRGGAAARCARDLFRVPRAGPEQLALFQDI